MSRWIVSSLFALASGCALSHTRSDEDSGGGTADAMVMIDARVPPRIDAGRPRPRRDAGPRPIDAGPPRIDSGRPRPRDGGPRPIDSGPPRRDSGPPRMDAGPPRMDAGPPRIDSGPPRRDSGPPILDGGLPAPLWVPLDIRIDSECPAAPICGGDVVGTWDVRDGCFEVTTPEDLSRCPGGEITSATGRVRGRVTFDGTFATRTADSQVTVEIFVPRICALFAGGCAAIQRSLRMSSPDTDCATDMASDCRCTIHQNSTLTTRERYTIAMNQVRFESGRRWDYCIAGDRMTYSDVSTTVTPEPGTIVLGRR